MIVDLENGDRCRVIMLRQFVAADNETTEEVIELRLEGFNGVNIISQSATLTVRECRQIANYLEWLALKVEEENR